MEHARGPPKRKSRTRRGNTRHPLAKSAQRSHRPVILRTGPRHAQKATRWTGRRLNVVRGREEFPKRPARAMYFESHDCVTSWLPPPAKETIHCPSDYARRSCRPHMQNARTDPTGGRNKSAGKMSNFLRTVKQSFVNSTDPAPAGPALFPFPASPAAGAPRRPRPAPRPNQDTPCGQRPKPPPNSSP